MMLYLFFTWFWVDSVKCQSSLSRLIGCNAHKHGRKGKGGRYIRAVYKSKDRDSDSIFKSVADFGDEGAAVSSACAFIHPTCQLLLFIRYPTCCNEQREDRLIRLGEGGK